MPGEDFRADPLADKRCDLAWLGVAAQTGFGEDQDVVKGDLEAPFGPRDQLDHRQDWGPTGEQFVRQTDGSGNVVSGDAELDGHPVPGVEHVRLLSPSNVSATLAIGLPPVRPAVGPRP